MFYFESEPPCVLQIDKAQDQVQHAKTVIAQKPCAASTEQLKAAREQRNGEQEKLEALLLTRELIVAASRQVYFVSSFFLLIIMLSCIL